jgi:Amiloride-sensitive sodium channel
VVVCPTEPYDEEQVKKVAEELHETESEKFIPFLQALTRLSYENLGDAHTASLNVSDEKALDTMDLRKLMFSTSINCNETFAWCKFKSEEVDCCKYFFPVYNEHGYCFGFNSRYTYAEKTE